MPLNKLRLKIPTALSEVETLELMSLSDGKRVLEAGALLGYSTIALAQRAAAITSVDKHEGYTDFTYGKFTRNLDIFGVKEKVNIVREDAVWAFKHFLKTDFDVAFIDLTGEYHLTRAAISACRAGIIAVHDFGRPFCDGVERAVRDSGLEILRVIDTTAILKRGNYGRRTS